MEVAQVLDTLGRVLPTGARASWLSPDDTAAPGVTPPEPGVAELVAGLAAVLARHGEDFTGESSGLLLESAERTLLAHRLGAHGTLVVEAGPDLNLALVRRLVRTALADGATAGAVPSPAPNADDDAPAPAALPRRSPPPRATDFRYEPEDLEVLRQLREALTG